MNLVASASQLTAWLVRRRLLGMVILAMALLLALVLVATGPKAEPRQREERAWPVSIQIAEPSKKSPMFVAYGKVESRQVATLKTSVGAPVESVLAPEGSWVEKDELLVRLASRELELALRRVESEYKRRVALLTAVRNDYRSAQNLTTHHEELRDIAVAKRKRYEELFRSRMIADEILDEARRQASERAITLEQHLSHLANFPSLIAQHEAMVVEAKAELETVQIELEQTEIRSPFAGRVIEALVSPGDRILPGVPLIRIADYESLEVRAPIPAKVGDALRARLGSGNPITAIGMLDDREIHFTLVRMSGDVKSGQSGLDAFFKPRKGEVLDIGRVLNLSVKLPLEENVVAVPIQSVYENTRVYKVEQERLVGVSIEQVGDYMNESGDFRILVRSDELRAGDRIVTTQLPRAITGLLVEPVDASEFDQALAADPTREH
ncbi:MAG: HlyD family efflux transporter periplasmic adaptor subunit [Pseudomonadales bacterium]